MTADEARRLTISSINPERLEDYHKAQKIIKNACTELIAGRSFGVKIKGPEFTMASIMALLNDGYHVWYDSSDLATHIQWDIDITKYRVSP